MSALDKYRGVVRRALEKDGWTITDDPYKLSVGNRGLIIDLGAEKLMAAEKAEIKIAVEIKTFGSSSPVADLQQAVGQFVMYESALKRTEPERILYLAVPELALNGIFAEELGAVMIQDYLSHLFGYSVAKEEITKWIP